MHSDQVTRYLLGQLPESEIQRLTALRETDENFRQRVQIVEDDLIDCFSKGQLQGEDLMRFRRYFLASAANRDRVKIVQGFLDDLPVVYENDPQAPWWQRLLPATWNVALQQFWQTSWRPLWLSARGPLLVLLRGVSMVLFVWCLYLSYEWYTLRGRLQENEEALAQATGAPTPPENSQLAQQINQTRETLGQLKAAAIRTEPSATPTAESVALNPALQPASFALRPAARGADSVPELSVNATTEEVIFQLELGRDDRASYRAELRAQPDGARLWQSGTLKARAKDYGKMLDVKIPAVLLKSRAYTLKVYGATAAGEFDDALNYSFRINKQ